MTYNSDPIGVAQDPNVLGHSRAFVSGGAHASPVDSNLKAISQDELTLGVERLFGPTLSVVGGGVATLLVVAAVAMKWPELRHIGPLHTLAPADDGSRSAT